MTDAAVKSCCALAYESEIARWLMGESYHPGGLRLTERLGERLGLCQGMRVLDVACGRGASAVFLAERFGCQITGVDLGHANVEAARTAARLRKLDRLATFEQADAEHLPFADGVFDAVICECALCLFPDKRAAAHEWARLLRPGGRLGLTDLVRHGPLEPALDGLVAWVACIADAQPLDSYLAMLRAAHFEPYLTERHDEALVEIADRTRQQLFAAEILVRLGKLFWPGFDFRAANDLARQANVAIASGSLGYALVSATLETSAAASLAQQP